MLMRTWFQWEKMLERNCLRGQDLLSLTGKFRKGERRGNFGDHHFFWVHMPRCVIHPCQFKFIVGLNVIVLFCGH